MAERWIPPGARGECWIPPGHVTLRSLVEQHGAKKMGDDLYLGRCEGFEWCNFTGKLRPIAREEWATFKARYWLGLDAPPVLTLAQVNADDGSFDRHLRTYDPALHTFYLCPERILVRIADNPVSQPSLDGNPVSQPPPRQRLSPQADRIKQAIAKCFPSGTDGIPTKAVHKAVADELVPDSKKLGLAIPSETSVKRVLGRRK